MKRSQLNLLIEGSLDFFQELGFMVPVWARWKAADWKDRRDDCSEIIDNMLGWDITDFGSGDFHACGLIMFTLRNGSFNNPAYEKKYAEKIMIVEEGQVTPMHFHWSKREDIINRGGGNLVIQLYNSTKEGGIAKEAVEVKVDGIRTCVEAGGAVTLKPGDSITLVPGLFHKFWGEQGKGKVLVGEVSSVNDDTCDNRFFETLPRFPSIEEDQEPKYLLAFEYSKYL
jgi:D-lyxose ketol-isomerase